MQLYLRIVALNVNAFISSDLPYGLKGVLELRQHLLEWTETSYPHLVSLRRSPLFVLAAHGLANSRFHTLLFGINRLRSDEVPHC
jgi:hypothetical protein